MNRAIILLLLAVISFGQIPEVIDYQGKLTNASGVGIEGTLDMTFRLYPTLAGGTAIWSEVHSGADIVTIEKGLFSVELGSITPFDTMAFADQYFLEIEIDGDIMAPRQPLNTAAYAMRAKFADAVTGGMSLETVLLEGNSTGGTAITDDTDNEVDIADNLRLTDGNTLSVDNIGAEGTDDNINLMDDLDLNGNMIFNSNAAGYGGRVAFNDNIVPVSSAQDLGHADYRWDDIFLGATSTIDIAGDAGTAGEVLTIDGSGNLSWAAGGSGGTDTDWTMLGIDMYNTDLGNVSIGQSIAPAAANRLEVYGTGELTERAIVGISTTGPEGWLGTANYGAYGQFDSYNYGALGTSGIGIDAVGDTYAGRFTGDVYVTGAIKDSDDEAGTVGQVLTSTGTGTDWTTPAGGSGLWIDHAFDPYIHPTTNINARVYDAGEDYGFYLYKTSTASETFYGYYVDLTADNTSTVYGVNSYAGVYSGGGIGGEYYGVYGKAEYGDVNYGIYGVGAYAGTSTYGVYGTILGTGSSSGYAIYGDQGGGDYAGYFDGNVSITGSLEDADGDVGTAGQILTSTGTGTDWVDASGGTPHDHWGQSWTGSGTHGLMLDNSGAMTSDIKLATDVDGIQIIHYDSGADGAALSAYEGSSIGSEYSSAKLAWYAFGAGLGGTPGNIGVYGEIPNRGGGGHAIHGAVLTTDVTDRAGYFDGGVEVTGRFWDATSDSGTPGQILSSTGSGTDWIDPPSGGAGLWTDNGTHISANTSTNVRIYDNGTGFGNIYVGSTECDAITNFLNDGINTRDCWNDGDNTLYGYFTTGADIGVYSSADTAAVLNGDVRITGRLKDSSADEGTDGQLLSSTGTGTDWVDLPQNCLAEPRPSTELISDTDDAGLRIPLTFTFLCPAGNIDSVYFTTNGRIIFRGLQGVDFTNTLSELREDSGSDGLVFAPYWEDLRSTVYGEVRTNPQRYVLHWVGYDLGSVSRSVEFQVVIYPEGGLIVHYIEMNDNDIDRATIGWAYGGSSGAYMAGAGMYNIVEPHQCQSVPFFLGDFPSSALLREAPVESSPIRSDFGMAELTGERTWVNFSDDFKEELKGKKPVVTVTPLDLIEGSLYVSKVTEEGFAVTSDGEIGTSFSWISMVK